MMVFEKLIRYAGLAVGLKPSARGCEARLRGLERIIYSKTIISVIAASESGIRAVLRYVEPLPGFLERSIFASGGLMEIEK